MDYSTIQSDAYDQIAENGVAMVLKVTTMGTYSAASDSFATHATSYSIYGLPSAPTGEKNSSWMQQVEVGDKLFLVPGIDSSGVSLPRLDEMGDTRRFEIQYRTKTWVPVSMNVVEPGGIVLLYKIQARS
jgi:hypothetical protein